MMSNEKAPLSFEIHTTGDGSPTLSLFGGEKMHSLEGALSESLFIYQPCIQWALQQTKQPRVLSMGLGMGYNELITVGESLRYNTNKLKILSLESVAELNRWFGDWLKQEETPLNTVYNDILQGVAKVIAVPADELKAKTKELLANGSLELHGPLPSQNPWDEKFHCLLYDAFSGGTDKGLWSTEHLAQFLAQYADATTCVLGTYAATGHLKRSLKDFGFSLEKKNGFGMKRESTFATLLR